MTNISSNNEITKDALKLSISEIIFKNRLNDLLLLSQCDMDTILEQLKDGTVSIVLANAIIKVLDIDLDILLGNRKLTLHQVKKMEAYCNVKDENNILKKIYDVAKVTQKENDVLNAGGYINSKKILNAIKENKIPKDIKHAFVKGLNLDWLTLYNYSKKELIKMIPIKKDKNYKPVGFTDILLNNGLIDQINDYMYAPTEKSLNNTKIMEKISKSIDSCNFRILRKYNREEFNELIYPNFNYRSGYNYNVVVDLNNFRFQQLDYNNEIDGFIQKRYFIVDFNETEKIDGLDYSKSIYELELESFNELISIICSAKFDIIEEFKIEDAKKDLEKIEKVIGLCIEYYNNILKLESELFK